MTPLLAPGTLDLWGLLHAPHTGAHRCDCARAWRRAPMGVARAACALRHVLLASAQAVAQKHARPSGETAAQAAARRNEEAVQLLLHLHLLQLRAPDPAAPIASACWRVVPAAFTFGRAQHTRCAAFLRSHTTGSVNKSGT